jgi:hypothetical protein
MDIVNEGSSCAITLWFKDENEKNITPTSITWRLDDAIILSISGDDYAEIIGNTIEVPTTHKHNIMIPETGNIIINPENIWEEKIVTVKFQYLSSVGTNEFRYLVKNLAKVITPV